MSPPLAAALVTTARSGAEEVAQATTTTTAPGGGGLVEGLPDIASACEPDGSFICEWVYDRTGSEWWAGAAEWFIARPLSIVVILAVAWVVNRLARHFVKRIVERTMLSPDRAERLQRLRKRTPNLLLSTQPVNLRIEARAQTMITVFRGVATVLVWFVAFLAILEVLQINLGPVLAGAGIVGVALGFGAQNLVRDFLSGTFIILEDQYGVGDIVDLGDAVGVVEKVTLRVTRLRDVNGVVWHVPNGEILRVANKSQDWARAVLDVDVAYATDLDAAAEVIERTAVALSADEDWRAQILETPELWGVERFGPDGVTMRVVIKTRPAEQFDVLRELRRRLKVAFDAEGIEIPFQQRTLWIRQAEAGPHPFDPDGGGGAGATAPPTTGDDGEGERSSS